MIPYKNTSIMKTAAELKIKRDEYIKDIDEKRKQEAEEWLINNSEKIEKQIIEKGICTGQIMMFANSIFGICKNSMEYPYEFGAVSFSTYDLIFRKLTELGFKVNVDTSGSSPIFTLKILLPNKL